MAVTPASLAVLFSYEGGFKEEILILGTSQGTGRYYNIRDHHDHEEARLLSHEANMWKVRYASLAHRTIEPLKTCILLWQV